MNHADKMTHANLSPDRCPASRADQNSRAPVCAESQAAPVDTREQEDIPLMLLHRMLTSRKVDAAAAQWLSFGFHRWIFEDHCLPPLVHFGLPSTPQRPRLAMREFWLRQASRHISGDTTWRRACALLCEIDRFQRNQQAAWMRYSVAPSHATALDSDLHAAARAYPEFPSTPQALRNILEAD